jgi:type IV pilus assembly protein PilM
MIGLDISSSSVKMVELDQVRPGEYSLVRCAIEPLEKGWVVDGNIEKLEEVADAVKRLLKKAGSRTKNVALALPAGAVITKKINLPAGLREEEMEIQVEGEANQYIPFSLDEVALDFCVLGASPSSPGDVEVVIAASRREKVEDRQAVAEASGLKPLIVDVESYASRLAAQRLVERLPGRGRDVLVALFEIGAMNTSLQVMRNGEVLYERDQAFGGAQLTQQLARQYGFSPEEAEAKKRSGDLPDDYEQTVLAPFVDTLAAEVARSLQFFFTSTPHNRVDYIMLAGGTAAIPGLVDKIVSVTNVAAMIANPFDGMQIADGVREKKLRREAPSYLTSCGLAMRRFLQ